MGEERPHQRQAEPLPDRRQQEDVDVLFSQFPVCTVKDQVQLALWEERKGEARKQVLWDVKADKPT